MYADRILEIVRYTGARKIPCPLPYVVGILELRRHIVTVVDLHKRVGLPPLVLSPNTVMIVATLSSGTFGILVDNISDFLRVSEEHILPPISIAGLSEYLLHGVLTDADDILPIPDFDKIFSSFLHIHLVPINFSEKIAFQYRFTPGSLTQTLEKNLLARQTLDDDIVKKLPGSLYIPSIKVHRMTTYYADFSPRKRGNGEKNSWRIRASRAGDEKYVALSQKLDAQHYEIGTHRQGTVPHDAAQTANNLIDTHASASPALVLEHMLHHLPCLPEGSMFGSHRKGLRKRRLLPTVGRLLAQKLRIAPTQVTKYFSYYATTEGFGKTSEHQTDHNTTFNPQLPPVQTREGSETLVHALLKTLKILHQEQRTLTPEKIAGLCAEYQVSPLKLARILSFFPEYTVPIDIVSPANSQESITDVHETSCATADSDTGKAAPFNIDTTGPFMADIFWQLADQSALDDGGLALREVAARKSVPTCRLSKFQRYWWKHEQTD
jgi:purine-binding chemotaxis protein CheW